MSKLRFLYTNCVPQSQVLLCEKPFAFPCSHGTQTLRGTRVPACSLYLKVARLSLWPGALSPCWRGSVTSKWASELVNW